mmetsp:Transcript_1660/g.5824  ORF Transcript_1660/g.5824 Transcript_1660/m.5824 type:complete len:290 (-) Transcript_1660:179-1048(-)
MAMSRNSVTSSISRLRACFMAHCFSRNLTSQLNLGWCMGRWHTRQSLPPAGKGGLARKSPRHLWWYQCPQYMRSGCCAPNAPLCSFAGSAGRSRLPQIWQCSWGRRLTHSVARYCTSGSREGKHAVLSYLSSAPWAGGDGCCCCCLASRRRRRSSNSSSGGRARVPLDCSAACGSRLPTGACQGLRSSPAFFFLLSASRRAFSCALPAATSCLNCSRSVERCSLATASPAFTSRTVTRSRTPPLAMCALSAACDTNASAHSRGKLPPTSATCGSSPGYSCGTVTLTSRR